jgi:hypothetical protein
MTVLQLFSSEHFEIEKRKKIKVNQSTTEKKKKIYHNNAHIEKEQHEI